jgi:hypothetical protein
MSINPFGFANMDSREYLYEKWVVEETGAGVQVVTRDTDTVLFGFSAWCAADGGKELARVMVERHNKWLAEHTPKGIRT